MDAGCPSSMASQKVRVHIDEVVVNKNSADLREEVIRVNRHELAQAARKARQGEGTWHSLDNNLLSE